MGQWCLHRAELWEDIRPPPRLWSLPFDGEIEGRAPRNLLLVGGHADHERVPPAPPRHGDRHPREGDAPGGGGGSGDTEGAGRRCHQWGGGRGR
uniref:Uncharacterized protein n=1 Tax=Arundo donax TaxID=35708 RepID=A0A0A9GBG2_ARUDO